MTYITCYNPGMETREHVAEIVRKGVEEIREEERLNQQFHSRWNEVRDLIEAVAKTAAQGARDVSPNYVVHAKPENGCHHVYFSLKPKANLKDPCLRFCPDYSLRTITLSSEPEELFRTEPYAPDKLSEDLIGTAIGDFIAAALKQEAGKRRRNPRVENKLAKYLG